LCFVLVLLLLLAGCSPAETGDEVALPGADAREVDEADPERDAMAAIFELGAADAPDHAAVIAAADEFLDSYPESRSKAFVMRVALRASAQLNPESPTLLDRAQQYIEAYSERSSTAMAYHFAAMALLDADAQLDPVLAKAGLAHFEKNQCNSCHPAGGVDPSNPDKSNWGPDLALAAARLKAQWIRDWLKEPASIQPGTKMPTYFGETTDGEFAAFEDGWEKTIREIQHYLRHMESMSSGGPVSKGE
jgi:cytochrome c2